VFAGLQRIESLIDILDYPPIVTGGAVPLALPAASNAPT
jgi:hypothetical protein